MEDLKVLGPVNTGPAKKVQRALSTLGAFIGGGALGAVGMYSYNRKRHNAQRNMELLLIWAIKNVHVNVGEEKVGIQFGPAKVSFAKPQPQAERKKPARGSVDDSDIDID